MHLAKESREQNSGFELMTVVKSSKTTLNSVHGVHISLSSFTTDKHIGACHTKIHLENKRNFSKNLGCWGFFWVVNENIQKRKVFVIFIPDYNPLKREHLLTALKMLGEKIPQESKRKLFSVPSLRWMFWLTADIVRRCLNGCLPFTICYLKIMFCCNYLCMGKEMQ